MGNRGGGTEDKITTSYNTVNCNHKEQKIKNLKKVKKSKGKKKSKNRKMSMKIKNTIENNDNGDLSIMSSAHTALHTWN